MAESQGAIGPLDCPVCSRSVAAKGSEAKRFAVYHCPSVGRKHFTAFVLRPSAALNIEARTLDAEASELLERLNALVERGK